jgi:hypothetical protein
MLPMAVPRIAVVALVAVSLFAVVVVVASPLALSLVAHPASPAIPADNAAARMIALCLLIIPSQNWLLMSRGIDRCVLPETLRA